MDTHLSTGPQLVTVGDPEPIAVQIVDLTARYSKLLDPQDDILSVWLCIECGHGAGGPDPHLWPVNLWNPPEPLSLEEVVRWAQLTQVAQTYFGVQPRLMAEIERIGDELAMCTFWLVAEKWAPSCRQAVRSRGEWRLLP